MYSPDLYVNEQAVKSAPVRITGNYGREVLREAWRFKPKEPEPGLFRAHSCRTFSQASDTYARVRRSTR